MTLVGIHYEREFIGNRFPAEILPKGQRETVERWGAGEGRPGAVPDSLSDGGSKDGYRIVRDEFSHGSG